MSSLGRFTASLRDPLIFPKYEDCPMKGGGDAQHQLYYAPSEGTGLVRPVRHWCLLGEIEHNFFPLHPQLTLIDKAGSTIIADYSLADIKSRRFTGCGPRDGRAVAILYAERCNLTDDTSAELLPGVQLRDTTTTLIFPCGLDELIGLNDRMLDRFAVGRYRSCEHCGKESPRMYRCKDCHGPMYCGQDCAQSDWNHEGHKPECDLMARLTPLLCQNWTRFDGYYTFPFQHPTRDPTEAETMSAALVLAGLGQVVRHDVQPTTPIGPSVHEPRQ